MYRIWYSTEDFADYIIEYTNLKDKAVEKKKLYESDANNKNFHKVPDHIKKILYLDCPDLIIELNDEPILSIELSKEAGTGHNAFQRFARLAAAVENNVPAFYIYPEAVVIERKDSSIRWDKFNPLVFKALNDMMDIYKIPALLFFHPSRLNDTDADITKIENKGLVNDENYISCPNSSDDEMQAMFRTINEIVKTIEEKGVIEGRGSLISNMVIRERRNKMAEDYAARATSETPSPLSSTKEIDTEILLNYLSKYESDEYQIGSLLRSREKTIVYCVNAKFRGDPYPGALAAIDYLKCREGKTFEDRKYNLIMVWGKLSVDLEKQSMEVIDENGSSIKDFVSDVKSCENRNLLTKEYQQLNNSDIPRYYMQVRYGSMFSKVKHIRVYSYFADAIIFPDGSLWRDA